MGRLQEFYRAWHRNRAKVDWMGAGVGALMSTPMWYEIFSQGRITSTNSAAWATAQLAAPVIAAGALPLARAGLGFLVDEAAQNRRLVRGIARELKKVEPPTMECGEGGRLPTRFSDVVHGLRHLDDDTNAETFLEQAQKEKNPYLMLRASWRFMNNMEMDVGLSCVREALDWTGGKTIRLPYGAYPLQAIIRAVEPLSRVLFPANVENYMGLAGMYALTDAKKAWFYAELGRRVAGRCSPRLKKEAYVFHALLASAQRRSDVQSAWRDALQLLMEGSQVEAVSERESRSEVFRFDGEFFANTLVVKKRPDLEGLVREESWQMRGKELLSSCDAPEPLYVSQGNDGLSCFAMRYRKGEVLYDLLERGDKSSVKRVAGALGEIHAKLPQDGLGRVDIWGKARDKLYDSLLGVPKDLANTILSHYGPVDRGSWRAPPVINKDAHPEQWIVGERLTAIDWEIDSLVPLTFDAANFTAYRNFFSQGEEREFVGSHVDSYKKNGGDVRGEDVLVSYYNAVIHRMVCFIGAWSGPRRKQMRQYRQEAVERAIGAIDALEANCRQFYQEFADDYRVLRKSFVKVAGLMVP